MPLALLKQEHSNEKGNMKNRVKLVLGTALAIGIIGVALVTPKTEAASTLYSVIGAPTAFNTETLTTASQVTNKVVPYNVTSYGGTNQPIDISGGTIVAVTVHQRYTTTSIPSTNTTYQCQVSNDKVNWHNIQAFTVAGNTTDGAYSEAGTNLVNYGFRYFRLYSVLPLAPLTNSQVLINVK